MSYEVPGQWPGMLDEVYACLRRAGVKSGCNVMIHRDLPEADQVGVEVGVEVNEPFTPDQGGSGSANGRLWYRGLARLVRNGLQLAPIG